jgi:hypothetical protein
MVLGANNKIGTPNMSLRKQTETHCLIYNEDLNISER